jgi:hypothetical protein
MLKKTCKLLPPPSNPLAKTWVTDVNPLRKRSLLRPSQSVKPRWSKAVSKLRDNPNKEVVSKQAEAAVVDAVVVVEIAEEEVALHSLPMVTKENREKDAQEPKVVKEEVETEAAVEVVEEAEEAKKAEKPEKVSPDVVDKEEAVRDTLTPMVRVPKSNVPKEVDKEKDTKVSPEKKPTLSTANQELDVEREINKNPEVAVDNGETQSKTSPKVKLLKVKKSPLKKVLKPRLKNPLKKLRSKNPLRLKNPMYLSALMIT